MHIIGGQLRGHALQSPSGSTTRPTSARARETIFNMLDHAAWSPGLQGMRVLDAFAGSGALGFEALSRGAAFCLFMDISAQARGALRSNIDSFDLYGITRIHRRDILSLGRKPAALGAEFDLVFLDPPYGSGLESKALIRLVAGGWLSPKALVIVETQWDTSFNAESFVPLEDRRHGMARHWFLQYRKEE